jgi:hypothetical protein
MLKGAINPSGLPMDVFDQVRFSSLLWEDRCANIEPSRRFRAAFGEIGTECEANLSLW